jgi:ADP-ribose pyrophosphatase
MMKSYHWPGVQAIMTARKGPAERQDSSAKKEPACQAQQSRGKPMSRQVLYRGKKIQLVQETTPGADGQPVTRDIVEHPGAVAILPLLDSNRVCLLRNRRATVGETLIEIPAGTLEPGENPDRAGPRELAEETGYTAGRWRKLAEFYPSPGILSEKMYLYLAEDLTPGPMRPERDEDLQPFVVSWDQALTWVFDGTIKDAKTLVAVMLWDRIRGNSECGIRNAE